MRIVLINCASGDLPHFSLTIIVPKDIGLSIVNLILYETIEMSTQLNSFLRSQSC